MRSPITQFLLVIAVGGILVGWISFAPIEPAKGPGPDVVVGPMETEGKGVDAPSLAKEPVVEAAPEAVEKTADNAVEAPADVTLAFRPHRAIYEIALKSSGEGSGIVSIKGDMSFIFNDRCDGWTAENNSLLNIQYAQGGGMAHRQSFVTWEAKDGQEYRYRVRRFVDDQISEDIKGNAIIDDTGAGQAVFSTPEEAEMPLVKGTRFPSGFLKDLIVAAQNGENILARTVFEGDEMETPYLVSTVINSFEGEESEQIAAKEELDGVNAWTFRLAYFRADNRSPEPEFELNLVYRADGIADQIIQDFGDYALKFKLKELELLEKPAC